MHSFFLTKSLINHKKDFVMQTEKEPPTNPTYEDLKNLNSDDLLDVDINSIPKHLHSYVVGRLDECIQADTSWLSISGFVLYNVIFSS